MAYNTKANQLMSTFSDIKWPTLNSSPVIASNNLTLSRVVDAHCSKHKYFIKTLAEESDIPDSVLLDQFLTSYRQTRKLMHPCILRPIAMIDQPEGKAVVYPYKDVNKWKQLDFNTLSNEPEKLLIQIAGAIDFLHLKGLVHRDTKLENFLVNDRNEVLLVDHDYICEEGESHYAFLFGTPALLPSAIHQTPRVSRFIDYTAPH
jgi:serine/threonine protein kinase